MLTKDAYWTQERITRLETMLARYEDDVFAQSFLQQLSTAKTLEQKQQIILESLPIFLESEVFTTLWEGREIPTHLVLRDRLLDYLHSEGIIQNIPTGESANAGEEAERERLAQIFGQGKRVSDILLEDRE